MILFVHAAAVSLAATQAGVGRMRRTLAVRHALVTDLVDPRAMNFAGDDVDYARLRAAVATHLRGGESRVILSCSVYNAFAPRLALDLNLPVERSDDAGARRTLEKGRRIGLAVSYPPSYAIVEAHLLQLAAERGVTLDLEPLLRGNAFAYADDAQRYGTTLLESVERADDLDAVFLAQFSMDPFAPRVGEALNIPVVSALEATLTRIMG
jgi:hypothetical protein